MSHNQISYKSQILEIIVLYQGFRVRQQQQVGVSLTSFSINSTKTLSPGTFKLLNFNNNSVVETYDFCVIQTVNFWNERCPTLKFRYVPQVLKGIMFFPL